MNLIGGMFNFEAIIPMMIFAIPIVAIVGGITSAIVKTLTDAKMIEGAQRERLAAIQRGIDPNQLPPLPNPGQNAAEHMAGYNPLAAQRHRAQGLLVGGIVTTFAGIGIGMFLYFIAGGADSDAIWSVGIIPTFVGVALLLCSWLLWPKGGNGTTSAT